MMEQHQPYQQVSSSEGQENDFVDGTSSQLNHFSKKEANHNRRAVHRRTQSQFEFKNCSSISNTKNISNSSKVQTPLVQPSNSAIIPVNQFSLQNMPSPSKPIRLPDTAHENVTEQTLLDPQIYIQQTQPILLRNSQITPQYDHQNTNSDENDILGTDSAHIASNFNSNGSINSHSSVINPQLSTCQMIQLMQVKQTQDTQQQQIIEMIDDDFQKFGSSCNMNSGFNFGKKKTKLYPSSSQSLNGCFLGESRLNNGSLSQTTSNYSPSNSTTLANFAIQSENPFTFYVTHHSNELQPIPEQEVGPFESIHTLSQPPNSDDKKQHLRANSSSKHSGSSSSSSGSVTLSNVHQQKQSSQLSQDKCGVKEESECIISSAREYFNNNPSLQGGGEVLQQQQSPQINITPQNSVSEKKFFSSSKQIDQQQLQKIPNQAALCLSSTQTILNSIKHKKQQSLTDDFNSNLKAIQTNIQKQKINMQPKSPLNVLLRYDNYMEKEPQQTNSQLHIQQPHSSSAQINQGQNQMSSSMGFQVTQKLSQQGEQWQLMPNREQNCNSDRPSCSSKQNGLHPTHLNNTFSLMNGNGICDRPKKKQDNQKQIQKKQQITGIANTNNKLSISISQKAIKQQWQQQQLGHPIQHPREGKISNSKSNPTLHQRKSSAVKIVTETPATTSRTATENISIQQFQVSPSFTKSAIPSHKPKSSLQQQYLFSAYNHENNINVPVKTNSTTLEQNKILLLERMVYQLRKRMHNLEETNYFLVNNIKTLINEKQSDKKQIEGIENQTQQNNQHIEAIRTLISKKKQQLKEDSSTLIFTDASQSEWQGDSYSQVQPAKDYLFSSFQGSATSNLFSPSKEHDSQQFQGTSSKMNIFDNHSIQPSFMRVKTVQAEQPSSLNKFNASSHKMNKSMSQPSQISNPSSSLQIIQKYAPQQFSLQNSILNNPQN